MDNDTPAPNREDPPAARVPRRYLQRGLRLVGILAMAYATLVVFAMFLETSLIYFPMRHPHGDWHPAGLEFEDAWFQAADGVRLHGWYVPRQDARGAVLYCHGNGGNLTHRIPILHMLHDLAGVSVLLFDYRGYGRSEGSPDEAGTYADARAARAWLAQREGIAESDVVLMGESLGGAVAVDLAARDGARALVLDSTFSSLPDAAAFHYPYLPVRMLMRTRYDSAAKIAQYRGPLLQIHGAADTIVPLALGRALYDAANRPKQFLEVPDGDHNDLKPPAFYEAIGRMLEKTREQPASDDSSK